jgi:hypothetical protein
MRVTIFFAAMALLAACTTTASTTDARLECTTDSRTYFVTHPWICLREGGRLVETAEGASDWTSLAVSVRWQWREEIRSGHLYYRRTGDLGELLLELPSVEDACKGDFTLWVAYEGEFAARCESGQTLRGSIYLKQYRVAASARGEDGEGRNFGFYAPEPES